MRRRDLLRTGLSALLATPAAGAWAREDDPYAVLDDAAVLNPFDWVEPIATLWGRGDRLQAAFWYYVFQIRSRPWAEADRRGDGAAALRGAVTSALGAPINEWIAADPAAWRGVGGRAIAFEKDLPLHAGRPDGVDEAEWRTANQRARAAYEDGFDRMWRQYSDDDIARQRRENGLHVGPLTDPGRPLRW